MATPTERRLDRLVCALNDVREELTVARLEDELGKHEMRPGFIVETKQVEGLFCEVINTRDVITFQADSAEAIERAFHDSVDDYLEFCKSRGEKPEKPFSGTFTSINFTPSFSICASAS